MDAMQANFQTAGATFFVHCDAEITFSLGRESFEGKESLGALSLQGRVIFFTSHGSEEGQKCALLDALAEEANFFGKYMAIVSPGLEVSLGLFSFSAEMIPLSVIQSGSLQVAREYKAITIMMFLGRDQGGYLQRFVVVTKKGENTYGFDSLDRESKGVCQESIAAVNGKMVDASQIQATVERSRGAVVHVAQEKVEGTLHAGGREHSVVVSSLREIIGPSTFTAVGAVFANMSCISGTATQYTEGLLKPNTGKVFSVEQYMVNNSRDAVEMFLSENRDVTLSDVEKEAFIQVISKAKTELFIPGIALRTLTYITTICQGGFVPV